jgi:hypothetical protein
MQHKVQADFSRIHHLLCRHFYLSHVSVLVESLNDRSTLEPRDEEVDMASGLPSLLGDDLLGFVVDVVDRSGKGLSGIVLKGVED